MKKKLIFTLFVLFLSIISVVLFYKYYTSTQKQYGSAASYISQLLPENFKQFLKETVFVVPTLKKDLAKSDRFKNLYLYKAKKLEEKYYLTLKHQSNEDISIIKNSVLVKKHLNKKITLNKKNLTLEYFQVSSISNPKHKMAISTGYLANYDKKIIFVTGDGNMYYISHNDFAKDEFNATKIPNNLQTLMNYKEFNQKSMYGIKDLFIKDDQIFVTSSSEKEKNCFNTAIFSSKINFTDLSFTKFYQPSLCVKKELAKIDEFSAYHSGGRLFNYDDDHIMFSSGEWRNRPAAQDESNNLGKIILINIKTKKTKLISMGHRNPQGLYYDEKNNVVVSTEHGPQGGDEININKTVGNKIQNFGWPISSYGTHYGEKKWQSKGIDQYAKAPLYKSHKKYGFREPIRYYSPALGISQIIKISPNFNIDNGNEYFLASMGSPIAGLSLRYIKFDDDYNNILNDQRFYLQERIRDIIFVEELNKYFLFFETSGSIAVLQHEN